jgi:hypothetical protein
MENRGQSRRTVLQRMAYVVPVVLTLAANPAFARNGSGEAPRNNKVKKRKRR